MVTQATSRRAWHKAIGGMRVTHPTYKARRRLALLRLFEEEHISGSKFELDSRLSNEFDAILLEHGALLGRGRVFQPLKFMQVRGAGSDQLWSKSPRSKRYRVESQFQPVLEESEGREWLRGALAEWLEGHEDPLSQALAAHIEDGLDSRSALKRLVEGASENVSVGGLFPSGGASVLSLGFDAHAFGAKSNVSLAERMIAAVRSGDTEMKFLDTESKRKVGQRAFSRWILTNFDGWCCFCPTRGAGIVEAAHILSVSSRPDRGMDPTNGLALCASHHRAFDRELVWVEGKRIHYAQTEDFVLDGLRAGARGLVAKSFVPFDASALREHAQRAKAKWA